MKLKYEDFERMVEGIFQHDDIEMIDFIVGGDDLERGYYGQDVLGFRVKSTGKNYVFIYTESSWEDDGNLGDFEVHEVELTPVTAYEYKKIKEVKCSQDEFLNTKYEL